MSKIAYKIKQYSFMGHKNYFHFRRNYVTSGSGSTSVLFDPILRDSTVPPSPSLTVLGWFVHFRCSMFLSFFSIFFFPSFRSFFLSDFLMFLSFSACWKWNQPSCRTLPAQGTMVISENASKGTDSSKVWGMLSNESHGKSILKKK